MLAPAKGPGGMHFVNNCFRTTNENGRRKDTFSTSKPVWLLRSKAWASFCPRPQAPQCRRLGGTPQHLDCPLTELHADTSLGAALTRPLSEDQGPQSLTRAPASWGP